MSTLEQTADSLTVSLASKQDAVDHTFWGAYGRAGYVAFATVKVTGTYANAPITFSLKNRTGQASDVSFQFANAGRTDPGVGSFVATGTCELYAYKSATSTWKLLAKKSERYDNFTLYGYNKPSQNNGYTVTWTSEQMPSLPEPTATNPVVRSGCTLEARTATNFMAVDAADGLVVGDRTASTLGGNVQLTAEPAVNLRKGSTVLASFKEKLIQLGKNATDAVIEFCGGLARICVDSSLGLGLFTTGRSISLLSNGPDTAPENLGRAGVAVCSTKSGTDRTSSVTIEAYSLVDEVEVAMMGVDAVRHWPASDEDSSVAYMRAHTVDIGYPGAAITLNGPVTMSEPLPVASGGTGAATAEAAAQSIVPVKLLWSGTLSKGGSVTIPDLPKWRAFLVATSYNDAARVWGVRAPGSGAITVFGAYDSGSETPLLNALLMPRGTTLGLASASARKITGTGHTSAAVNITEIYGVF